MHVDDTMSNICQAFTVFQGTSNSGQRSSDRKARVNRRSDLPHNGAIWRFDRLLLKNCRPPFEVPCEAAKALSEGTRGASAVRYETPQSYRPFPKPAAAVLEDPVRDGHGRRRERRRCVARQRRGRGGQRRQVDVEVARVGISMTKCVKQFSVLAT